MLGFIYNRKKLHHIGENLAQIGLLIQEIWQKQLCLRSGQIAVKEGRDGNVGLRLQQKKFASHWCKLGANRPIGSRDMAQTVSALWIWAQDRAM